MDPVKSRGPGIFILLLGSIFAVPSGFVVINSHKFSKDVVRVEGTVIRYEEQEKGSIPILGFVVNGQKYEVHDREIYRYPPNVGTKVPVIYKSGQPEKAQVDDWGVVFAGILGFVMGGTVMLLGLLGALKG